MSGSRPNRWVTSRPPGWTAAAGPSTSTTSYGGSSATPRVGGEKYAELDHHYGATTLLKQHVKLMRGGMRFDYIAKAGQHRAITISDQQVQPTVRALARQDNGLEPLFCYENAGAWHVLHSHQVNDYIAARAGGHFTAKEFRTWNATVLMALVLANAEPSARNRRRVVTAGVQEVARWLGDTPAVTRGSYIDPRLITRYETEGQRPPISAVPAVLPAPAEAEAAVAAWLAASGPLTDSPTDSPPGLEAGRGRESTAR
ncbi:MAG TPA: hypothetical protein VH480_16540 [Streptosporangiaceae bacterium]